MKKAILFISFLLSGLYCSAQNNYNLVIFSEDGEGFYAYVNGIRQNDKPETNIKVIDLNSQALSLRIQFENKSLPVLKQNMMPEFGYEHTLKIKKNPKRVMKIQYFGKVELINAPRTNAPTVQYHTAENPLTNPGEDVLDENTTVTTGATTSQTITSSTSIPSVNISVDVEENGNTSVTTSSAAPTNVVVTTAPVTPKKTPSKTPKKSNVSTTDNLTLGNTPSATVTPKKTNLSEVTNTLTSSSSTIITTTTITNSSSQNGPGKPGSDASIQPVITPTPANTSCNSPMTADAYEKLHARIDDTPFSSAKLSTAKLAVKNACMTSQQIKGICSLLGMDDDKLAYAKFAYSYCYDKTNFYQVSEAFSFSGTTDKLNKFLLEK